MSIVTRCPECKTSFKVVPDQIKISKGWARCGRCQTVFDALLNQVLVPQAAPTVSIAAKPAAAAPRAQEALEEAQTLDEGFSPSMFSPQDVPDRGPQSVFGNSRLPDLESFEDFTHSLQQARHDTAPAARPAVKLAPASVAAPATVAPITPAPLRSAREETPVDRAERAERADWEATDFDELDTNRLPLYGRDGPLVSERSAWAQDSVLRHVETDSDLDFDLSEQVPSKARADGRSDAAREKPAGRPQEPAAHAVPQFVRRAEQAARWQRPWVKVVLWIVGLLLLLLLAAQAAWVYRDYLAVAQPQLRSGLDQACAVLGCKIAPWRNIDAVQMESSGFVKVHDQQYRVSVGLRNGANFPVATPSVELVLNNADGRPLIRRVFSPVELSLPARTLAAHEEYTGSAVVEIASSDLSNEVVGYKMLSFYP